MPPSHRKILALGVASAFASGCAFLFGAQPSTGPALTSIPVPPGDTATTTVPTPVPGSGVATPQPLPEPRNVLTDLQLGYLVANSGGALSGSASGPAFLVSDNASLIGNSGAGLIGNSGGALIGNSGGALIGNSGGAYRLSGVEEGVANGFVYLTTPDERFYVNSRRHLLSTLTNPDGTFTVSAPATDSLIVNVLLKGNRRIVSLVDNTASRSLKVDLASTLVTEYLRTQAARHGFTFADVFADEAAEAALGRATDLTRELVKSDAMLSRLEPADLALNNLPVLRQKYVRAFGTAADQSISDEWVKLIKAVLDDPGAQDVKYRPLAITALDAGVLPGYQTTAVAAVSDGTVYVVANSPSSSELRELKADGQNRTLFAKPRLGEDAIYAVLHMATAPGGKLLLPDDSLRWVALFDPQSSFTNPPYLDKNRFDLWTNPRKAFDAYYQTTSYGSTATDIALDDAQPAGMYIADRQQHCIWYVPDALGNTGELFLETPFAGKLDPDKEYRGVMPGPGDPVPAAELAGVRLNQPMTVTFHRRADGKRFLYVADTGDQVLIEIALETNAVRRIAGVVPPHNGEYPRQAGCYSVSEEGGSPLDAHLRFPQKILFDHKDRLVFADSQNNLVRLINIYDPSPQIWTIAGIFQPEGGRCGPERDLPPFVDMDGEARSVVIGEPSGMTIDRDGNLLLTDLRSSRIRKLWLSFLE